MLSCPRAGRIETAHRVARQVRVGVHREEVVGVDRIVAQRARIDDILADDPQQVLVLFDHVLRSLQPQRRRHVGGELNVPRESRRVDQFHPPLIRRPVGAGRGLHVQVQGSVDRSGDRVRYVVRGEVVAGREQHLNMRRRGPAHPAGHQRQSGLKHQFKIQRIAAQIHDAAAQVDGRQPRNVVRDRRDDAPCDVFWVSVYWKGTARWPGSDDAVVVELEHVVGGRDQVA